MSSLEHGKYLHSNCAEVAKLPEFLFRTKPVSGCDTIVMVRVGAFDTMHIRKKPADTKGFWASDAGAVSVEWVVLSAAVLGLGAFSVGQIGQGSVDLANATQGSLRFFLSQDSETDAPETDGSGYALQRLSADQLAQWTTTYANQTEAQLLASVHLRYDQFTTHLQAQQWSQALQRIDYYHIIEQELASRSLPRPDDMPAAQTLFDMYNDARS